MNATLLGSGVLTSAEFLINGLLTLDPDGRRRLLAEAGMQLTIECTHPTLTLCVLIGENGLHLGTDTANTNVHIRGDALSLLQLLRQKDKISALRDTNVSITGDMAKAQALQTTLSRMSIDWEFYLGNLIGDIPTQVLRDGLDNGRKLAGDSINSLVLDLDEYLHEEKKIFPDRQSLDAFYNAVDELRLDVDRLAARIRQIENTW